MHPPTPIVGKTSPPERLVFAKIERQLDSDHVVLHSLRTFDHLKKPMAEADFVVVGPLGIFVIEVKGDYTCTNGVWDFPDDITKKESPLEQASGSMYAIKKRLEAMMSESGKAELFKAISFGSGFISTVRDLPGGMVEIPAELFLGPSRILSESDSSFRSYVARAQQYWMSKNARSRKLNRDEINTIAATLRPDVSAPLDAYTNLKLMDGLMSEATRQQEAVLRGALSNPRLLVQGMAGTGKTLLAVNVAERLSREGKKVLFLCFNDNLSVHLRKTVSSAVTVSTIHKVLAAGTNSQLAREMLKDYGPDRLWNEGMPVVFSLVNQNADEDKFDAVVIDEAQDVMTIDYLDAISCLVVGGVASGNAIFFYDPNQDIYGSMSEDALKYLHHNYYFKYDLSVNCRNTREVAALGSIMSEMVIPINEDLTSGRPQSPRFASRGELLKSIVNTIEELSVAGLPPSEIVVLSPRTLDNSLVLPLAQGASPVIVPWGKAPGPNAKAMFSTIHSFKGLESGAVILVDLDIESELSRKQLLYVGCSRAKAILCPVLPESNKLTYASLASSYGARLASPR
jgi:DNA polymerase III delta prime subunit